MADKTIGATAYEARKKYYKAWREKNKDKVRQYNAKYWAKRAKATRQESGRP